MNVQSESAFCVRKNSRTGRAYFIQKHTYVHFHGLSPVPFVDHYKNDTRQYETDIRKQYDTALHNINYNLKKIGETVGLSIPLTMYVARHSWASAASQNNIPLHVISQCLGHDSEHTTQIYLSSIDVNQMDGTNDKETLWRPSTTCIATLRLFA